MTNDEWINEKNSLLAVIEKQREALSCFDRDITYENGFVIQGIYWQDVQAARHALALTPENVRLVEVGSMQNDMRTGHTYNILFNEGICQPIGTKLYTIETIEAKGEAE